MPYFSHAYALLIGVDDNAVPTWALPDVAKDIAALSAVLIHPERCAYPPENVHVITGKDATKENILAGLAWLKERLKADTSDNETALVYYSGHGWQDTSLGEPDYYLIPYDVDKDDLSETALSAKSFARKIGNLDPRRLLVLLDCCHAGGIGVKDMDTAHLAPFSLPPGWLLGGQKAVEAGGKDLDAGLLMQGQGRAILNSSRSDEKSYIRIDHTMSIFTYHIIEALTGHAPHGPEDKEVTAADLLSHVWHRVPISAQADRGQPQHPDGQMSGNFPVALLLGGEGAPAGKALPDPRDPLPQAKGAQPRSAFDQHGQKVNGPQTNIAGDVNGPVLSGDFKGPVTMGSGTQISVGDVKASGGGTVNIAGRDLVQNKTDNSIQVGDISNSNGIAIGHGARATVTQTSGADAAAIARAFAIVLRVVDKMTDADEQSDARDALEKLKKEAEKGDAPNEGRVRKWLDFLAGLSGDVFEIAVATFTSPLSGLSTAFRKIVERAKEERAAGK